MRTNDCLPPQVEETVPNGQKVVLTLDTNPTDECSGVPTSKSDPKPDYGALFAAALPKYFGLDESPKTRGPHQKITLPQVSDGTLTVAISCRLPADSESVVRMPRSVVVHYKNAPLFSGSAGVLISTMGTKTYGNSTAQASVTNGVVTTRNSVALTANSNVQFVPIAFLNTYLMGSNRLHIDLQSGAGINPNGSKTKVEYFLGSALAWHGAYIAPGVHIAQAQYLTNGFSLDETIASNVTVPTAYRTTFRFGIAISYSPSVASSPSK